MSPQEIAGVLRRLHAAYGNEVTEDMGHLWANTFAGDEYQLMDEATHEWIRERTHFPTPADLRQVMRSILTRLDELPELPRASTLEIDGPSGGFKVAYDAYVQTVERQGRDPKSFDEFLGRLPEQLKRRADQRRY